MTEFSPSPLCHGTVSIFTNTLNGNELQPLITLQVIYHQTVVLVMFIDLSHYHDFSVTFVLCVDVTFTINLNPI